jgi:UDP-glucose 6-dehydrogenase
MVGIYCTNTCLLLPALYVWRKLTHTIIDVSCPTSVDARCGPDSTATYEAISKMARVNCHETVHVVIKSSICIGEMRRMETLRH